MQRTRFGFGHGQAGVQQAFDARAIESDAALESTVANAGVWNHVGFLSRAWRNGGMLARALEAPAGRRGWHGRNQDAMSGPETLTHRGCDFSIPRLRRRLRAAVA